MTRRGSALALLATLSLGAGCGSLPRSPTPPPSSEKRTTAAPPAAAPAEPAAPDELPTTARPLGYQLHLELDPGAPSFGGEATIEVELTAPARQLELHAVALTVERAELESGGQRWSVSPRYPSPSRLRLELGRELAGPLTVRLRYRGVTTADEQGLFRQDVGGHFHLYSQAEAQLARRILPCFDEPRHKVPWQLSVTAPAAAKVFANSAALRDEPLSGDRHRVDFAPTPPMPSFLLAVAAGPFRVVELGNRGRRQFPVHLVLPEGLPGSTYMAGLETSLSISAVERWFARPLPLAKLDLVAVPDFFGAMENPGLITMNASDLISDGGDRALRFLFARVMVHELAHQWFGNQVTPASWGDLWISEALATWVAQQPALSSPVLDAPLARISSQVAARLTEQRAPAPLLRATLGPDRMFDAISYDKGAAVITMLARWLGEARVKAALFKILDERAGGTLSTAELAAALGELDPQAERVVTTAVQQPGVPLLSFELACGEAVVPSVRVAFREGAGPLPVCLRFGASASAAPKSKAGQLCGVVEKTAELPLPMAAGQCPEWVIGNDDLRGYYRMRWPLTTDPRGPLPPAWHQTPAERLGLGWMLAAEMAVDLGEPGGAVPAFLAGLGQVREHARRRLNESEAALADLELIAAMSRWVTDAELPAWSELVARRGAPLMSPVMIGLTSTEGGEARTARALEVLVDAPWPAALAVEARARLARGGQRPAELTRDWQLALVAGGPAALDALVALAGSAEPAAKQAPALLASTPASSMPALFAALDRGALRWSHAVPALAQLLSRRASQHAALAALALRGEALGRELAPFEVSALLEAGRWLCSSEDAAVFARVLRPLAARQPRGAELADEVAAQIRQCDSTRRRYYDARAAAHALVTSPAPSVP